MDCHLVMKTYGNASHYSHCLYSSFFIFMCKLAFHLQSYFHLSTNSLPNTAPPYTVIYPSLFYTLFVTQNETKSGPFKVSFFFLYSVLNTG